MDKRALEKKLRKLRMANGVIMQKLADVIGVKTVSAYYRKERGSLQFSLREGILLARFYGMTVEELFGDALV